MQEKEIKKRNKEETQYRTKKCKRIFDDRFESDRRDVITRVQLREKREDSISRHSERVTFKATINGFHSEYSFLVPWTLRIYKFANVPVNSGRIDAERYGIARTANSSVDSARDLDIGAMVLALRAWKFDPRRILRATRDITLPASFNRRKLFARSPAVASGRKIESSKSKDAVISRLVLRTSFPSLLRSSNLIRGFRLPTNVLGMPTVSLSLSLLDRGILAKNNEIVCVSFRDQIRAPPLVFPISNANERVVNAANFGRNSITSRARSPALLVPFRKEQSPRIYRHRTRVNYR